MNTQAEVPGNDTPPDLSRLAPAWDKLIPPQAVQIVSLFDSISGISETRPVWNPEWLIGLEQFVRSIVRDEIKKSKPDISGRGPG